MDGKVRVLELETLDSEVQTRTPIYFSPSFISLPLPCFQDVTQVSHGASHT